MGFYVVKNYRFDNNSFAFGEQKGKVIRGNAIKCEDCGSYLTMLEWLPPIEVKLSKGKLGDVIFGTFNHFLVSEKFLEIYNKGNFNGILSFEPAKLFQDGKQLKNKYFYPKILLSEVLVNIEPSRIEFNSIGHCSTCQKAGRIIKSIKGLYLVKEEEIDTDIFCTKMLPGSILFSERLKQNCEDLQNLSFVKSHEYVPSWVLGE
jgi:hypothetical protein